MDVFDLMAKISLNTDDYEKGLNEAGNNTNKFGEKLASGFKTMGKVAGAGLVAIGTAVVGVTKQAVESYADYEQLVGGVETLFKDSAGKVQEYASVAYKTAGLSANEYMESVTGFSASLLQGLGGDTAKASEVANRAIIDMSDNANKMGTSMESIQNAYQGFAKQNYTMLDNLKLGYGGTKEEMSRLISDASKMTDVQKELGITVDASSMSFDNIINAISVMQQSLGITGTTAKEASATISGSIGMMKSAWTNLVTGMADDNANFSDLVGNFVESVGAVTDNLIPRIEVALNGVGELITQLAPIIISKVPELLATLLPKAIEAVKSITESISKVLPDAIKTFSKVIIENLPTIIQAGMELLMSLGQGIVQALPELIPSAIDAVIQIVDTLVDNVDMMTDGAIALIVGLADGLIQALPTLITKAPEIVVKLVTAIINNMPKLLEAGVKLIVSLGQGLIQAIPQVVRNIPGLIGQIVNAITGLSSYMANAGANLVAGLWNGIRERWANLVNNVRNLGQNLVNSVKSTFGIHSPSKVFAQIGEYCVEGFNEGIEELGDSPVLDSLGDSIGNLSTSLSTSTMPAQNVNVSGMDVNNNVVVKLEGDAQGLFRAVKQSAQTYTASTGLSAFA